MTTKKPKVPETKQKGPLNRGEFDLSQRKFSLSKMIKQMEMARVAAKVCEAKKSYVMMNFFSGLFRGYMDWLEELKIVPAVIMAVKKDLDMKEVEEQGVAIALQHISEQEKSLVLPGQVGFSVNAYLKEMFDKKLKLRKGRSRG